MGKTSESKTEINEDVAREADYKYNVAKDIAGLGYQPNRGVTIAAFTPQQEAAMRGVNTAANAFGMGIQGDPLAHMPTPEVSASGIRGYSTGADYDQMIARLPPEFRAKLDAIIAGVGGRPGPRPVRSNFNIFDMQDRRNSGSTDRGGVSGYGGGSRSVGSFF